MCTQLREIYDKKSPIFLIEIYILTATVIIITTYPPASCHSALPGFYTLIIIVSSLEIVFKSLILSIIHAINKETSKIMQNILVGVFVLCHLALWIYSIILYRGEQINACKNEEPHFFFMKMYMFIYGILLIGSLVLLLVLLFPVAVLTLFSFRKRENEEID